MKTTPDNNIEKWWLCNTLLNVLRKAKGLPIVPPETNPYLKKNRKKEIIK